MNLPPVSFLRHTAFWEGASFLLLVFVAMPLKYFAGQPLPVKVLGMAHGILFVILCAALARVHFSIGWPFTRSIMVFIASLLPFGPFLLDRKMREWEAEAAAAQKHGPG